MAINNYIWQWGIGGSVSNDSSKTINLPISHSVNTYIIVYGWQYKTYHKCMVPMVNENKSYSTFEIHCFGGIDDFWYMTMGI